MYAHNIVYAFCKWSSSLCLVSLYHQSNQRSFLLNVVHLILKKMKENFYKFIPQKSTYIAQIKWKHDHVGQNYKSIYATQKMETWSCSPKSCQSQHDAKLSMSSYTMLTNVAHWYMPNCLNSLATTCIPIGCRSFWC